jgi:hypothetical protein
MFMTTIENRVIVVAVVVGAAIVSSSRNAWTGEVKTAGKRRECSGLEEYQRATYRIDHQQWRARALQAVSMLDGRPSLVAGGRTQATPAKEFDDMIASTPSEFEDPGTFHLLSSLARDIDKARAKLAIPRVGTPCLGTLPIQTVNARAARVAGDARPYIVVNRSLFPFMHEMTKLALLTVEFSRAEPPAAATMSFGSDAYERQLSRYPEIRERMVDLVSEFLGGPQAPALVLGREYDPLLGAADQGAELFVVAHEYAHLIHNHLENGKLVGLQFLADTSGTTAGPPAYVHSWLQEIEADTTALKLTEKALDLRHSEAPRTGISISTEFSRRAPQLFLRYTDIVREALDIKLNRLRPAPQPEFVSRQVDALKAAQKSKGDSVVVPGVDLDTHPPGGVRVALLRENVKGWEGLQSVIRDVDENAFLRLADALDQGIQRLWRESRLLLLDSPGDSHAIANTPVMIPLTGGSDVDTVVLALEVPGPSPSTHRLDANAIFVSQGKECSVPSVSVVRFIAQDGITIVRPAARLNQTQERDTCTEGVAVILRESEARLLGRSTTMTIEFTGHQTTLSAAQLEDFRRGIQKR